MSRYQHETPSSCNITVYLSSTIPTQAGCNVANPPLVRYTAPNYEDAHGKDREANSKGVLKQQPPVTSKGGHVPLTYKVEQDPVSARTRSRADVPLSTFPFEA